MLAKNYDGALQKRSIAYSTILSAMIWDLLLIFLLFCFTPPLEPLRRQLFNFFTALDVRLFYYQSLFQHALAFPLATAMIALSVIIMDLRNRASMISVIFALVGMLLASGSAILIVLIGRQCILSATFYVGLLLMFVSTILLLYSLIYSITKFDKFKRLSAIALLVNVLFVLVTAMYGVFGSQGSLAWSDNLLTPITQRAITAHRHAIVSLVATAIVLLTIVWYSLAYSNDTAGMVARAALYLLLIGIPTLALSTVMTVHFGGAVHTIITPAGGLVLYAALLVMYSGIAKRVKDSGWQSLLKDPVYFGLFFSFFWVNIAVTLPGMYVAANLKLFAGHPSERPFILGHEHALATLVSITAILLIVEVFGVKGKLRAIIGISAVCGYVIASGAGILYIFLDPDPYNSFAMPYIKAGIVLMVMAVISAVLAMFRIIWVKEKNL